MSFKERLKDPVTYMSVALIVEGVGNLAKINEAEQVADVLQTVAPSISADPSTGILALVMGVIGIFLRKKVKF